MVPDNLRYLLKYYHYRIPKPPNLQAPDILAAPQKFEYHVMKLTGNHQSHLAAIIAVLTSSVDFTTGWFASLQPSLVRSPLPSH